ncbi:MAG: hypothetical protein KIH63_002595 [Candidatus Saccharibacteria bacterium]|nr:hypothetical protein [Candidatus Saccharibacteria bacterium]
MDDQTTGALLAIDDGYGTLADADVQGLAELLAAEGYEVVIWDYQAEDMPTGYFVARYEAGQYGPLSSTNPYIAVLLYIVDYFDAAQDIAAHVAEGSVVIALNFATSVVAREAVKFSSQPERAAFYLWADQMLFDTFGLKRPHKTVLINGDAAEVSVKARVFTEMSGVFSRDYKVIDAYRNGHRLAQDDIDHLIMESVRGVLPEPPLFEPAVKEQETASVPLPELPDSLSEEYQRGVADLLHMRTTVVVQLKEAGASEEEWIYVQALLTPLALQPMEPMNALSKAAEGITAGYSQDHTAVKLVEHWPKNEYDLLPTLLFPHSSLSAAELTARLDKLPFEQKDALLQTLLSEAMQSGTLSELQISYTFELLTSYEAMRTIQGLVPDAVILVQALTPRYEYEMPESIEQYNLTDAYLECFDKSFELFSRLESSAQDSIAPNACLRGHKLRWRLVLDGANQNTIFGYHNSEQEVGQVVAKMFSKLEQYHPLLQALLVARHLS